MQKLRVLRNAIFIFIAMSILSVGANATCNNCHGGEIGIGGRYTDLSGTEANVKSYGGYASLGAFIFYKRFYLDLTLRIGAGQNSLSGLNLVNLKTKDIFYHQEADFRTGVNILTAHTPLILNVFGNGYFDQNLKSVSTHLSSLGIGISGSIPIGKLNILYSGGYGWVITQYYVYNNSDIKAQIGGHNYMIQGSLGLSYNIANKTAIYIRAIGKYYNLNAAQTTQNISFPSSHQLVGMLEFGVRIEKDIPSYINGSNLWSHV